jgi:hypothetical protein
MLIPNRLTRRKFLGRVTLAGFILAFAPQIAEARFPRGAALSGFNGGKSQIQSSLSSNGEFPFVNLILTANAWAFADNSGWPSPNTLNSNGYPTTISNGGVATVFQIPTQTERSGDYVVITTGTGTISCTGISGTPVSGTNTQTTVPGASLGNNTSVSFQITATDATTPITKIAFVHNQDVAAYLSDNLAFGIKFINILQQANCGVIRFLDWQNGNFTNETNWASRTPLTNFSFVSGTFPQQRTDTINGASCQVGYLGQTTSVGNDYSISDSIGTAAPVDKQTILANFDAAAVTVASGANAQIAWTGHNLVTGSPFCMFTAPTGSAPGGTTLYPDPLTGSGGATIFYAIFVDSSHIKFATTQANAIAGTAITTTSTGSSVFAHATVVRSTVTITVATSNVGWPNHLLATGDPVGFSNDPCGNLSAGINYFAIVLDANNIQIATSKANALSNTKIVFSGSASGTSACRQPTLNLNGTGAISIRGPGGLISGINNWMPVARAYQNHTVYGAFTFDASLQAWIKVGADQAFTNAGVNSSVPPEVCLKLCKQLGAHPYFVSGFLMLDPMTDYMPSLMQYCKANGPSWMIPRFEGYNENWNSTPGSSYAQFRSFANWGVQELPAHNWVGKTCSTLGQAANTVWGGGKGTSYHILVGVQTTTIVDSTTAAAGNDRLVASQYTAQSAAAQTGYTKDPAYKWCTHVCCAQYITPSIYGSTTGTPNEVTMAATWTTNGSSPTDPLLTQYVDSLDGAVSGFNLAACALNYNAIFPWAQGAGVAGGWGGLYKLGMCGYEGGYSPSLGGGASAQVNNFRVASKYVADVGKGLTGGTFADSSVVAGTYNDFTAAGGIFPSCFQLGGGTGTGTGNAWSVLDPDIYLTPQPSQWAAIVAYNH